MSLPLQHVRSILDQAINHEVASSISLWVGNKKGCLLTMHAGTAGHHTIYDLASLTKILGTTLAIARACSLGRISLDEKPNKCWPQISVAHLLAHTSGLLAHKKFYLLPGIKNGSWDANRQTIFEALYEEKPTCAPGEKRLYSDLNFMALGDLLEQREKKPLWQIFEQTWSACGLKPLHYFPSGTLSDNPHVLQTGFCVQRREQVRAQVHDLNCYFLGGLSGHAGLFGSLESLALFGQFFLRCYLRPVGALENTLALFMRKHLGFDRPTLNGSVRFLSPMSFGHFGFTGTSLWIDPQSDQGKISLLLTNRVAKSLKPEPIFLLREKIHRCCS